ESDGRQRRRVRPQEARQVQEGAERHGAVQRAGGEEEGRLGRQVRTPVIVACTRTALKCNTNEGILTARVLAKTSCSILDLLETRDGGRIVPYIKDDHRGDPFRYDLPYGGGAPFPGAGPQGWHPDFPHLHPHPGVHPLQGRLGMMDPDLPPPGPPTMRSFKVRKMSPSGLKDAR
ncbi:hypothetical protein GOODEAATRI_026746, partial [Goodea atripinnis]